MEKLLEILQAVSKALFTRPAEPKRPLCRHCGGGKCYGACQMDIDRSRASSLKAPEGKAKE